MMLFIILIASLFLPFLLGMSLRNSRGVFLIYFLTSVIIPYGFYCLYSDIPTFLFPFVDKNNIDLGIFYLSLSFIVIVVSSLPLRNKRIIYNPLSYNQKSIWILSVVSTLFFIFYILISIIFSGSITDAFFSAYSRVRTNNSLANFRAVFLWGNIVFSTICGYLLFYKRINSRKLKIVILINLLLSGFLSLMDGGRAVFLMYTLSLLFGYIIKLSLSRLIGFSVQFSIFIGIISYFLIKARYETQNAQIISDGKIPLSESLNGLAYFDHFLISMQYAQNIGYDFGSNYVNAVLSFIPRDFYEGKAIPLSAQVRNFLYGDDTGGIPPGLLGEAYISGGLIGLLIISILYGRVLNLTANYCRAAVTTNCPIRFAIAGVLIPMIGFSLVRGGLDIGFLRVGIPLFWCIFAVKFIRIK